MSPELIAMTYFGELHVGCRCFISGSPDAFPYTSSELPTSKATSAGGLGTLSKLPPELRCLILQYLMPEHRSKRQTNLPLYLGPCCSFHQEVERPLERLSILQASQQLREEVSGELYNHRTLHLYIDPKHRGWTVKDLPEASPRDFHYTNYARFSGIKIEIHSPDVKDPGQLLRARKNTIDLVAMLTRSLNIQRIEIILFENDQSTWYDHDIGQRSVEWFDETDLKQLLGPFQYLYRCETLRLSCRLKLKLGRIWCGLLRRLKAE